MRIGVPAEIKDQERRVALTPTGARTLVDAGHQVAVQSGAGSGAGFADTEYLAAGARLTDAAGAWSSELVVKVKEPLAAEYDYFRDGLLLFCYLHLAAEPELTQQLAQRGVTAIAYETVEAADGSLPLLTPMSIVAGRMAPQIAAGLLTHVEGGRGKLLAGIPGVPPSKVTVLGAGVVGTNAARIALGMGALVTVFDRNLDRLRMLDAQIGGRFLTMAASPPLIAESVQRADVVIGAVLVPGARAPIVVSEAMVAGMTPGSVIVDIAVDQGGCIETIRPTSHSHPTYVKHGVVHYAVPNIPGAVPRTATMGLCDATLPYVQQLAAGGLTALDLPHFKGGVNVHDGEIVHPTVAAALRPVSVSGKATSLPPTTTPERGDGHGRRNGHAAGARGG